MASQMYTDRSVAVVESHTHQAVHDGNKRMRNMGLTSVWGYQIYEAAGLNK